MASARLGLKRIGLSFFLWAQSPLDSNLNPLAKASGNLNRHRPGLTETELDSSIAIDLFDLILPHLLQHLPRIPVRRIQLETLLIILDGKLSVAVDHVRLAETVVHIRRLRMLLGTDLRSLGVSWTLSARRDVLDGVCTADRFYSPRIDRSARLFLR